MRFLAGFSCFLRLPARDDACKRITANRLPAASGFSPQSAVSGRYLMLETALINALLATGVWPADTAFRSVTSFCVRFLAADSTIIISVHYNCRPGLGAKRHLWACGIMDCVVSTCSMSREINYRGRNNHIFQGHNIYRSILGDLRNRTQAGAAPVAHVDPGDGACFGTRAQSARHGLRALACSSAPRRLFL